MQKTTASSIEELISIGIDPLCPMSSDRIKGHPISIRFNDDLIERDFSGGIRHSFGYFFEHQVPCHGVTPAQIAMNYLHWQAAGKSKSAMFSEIVD